MILIISFITLFVSILLGGLIIGKALDIKYRDDKSFIDTTDDGFGTPFYIDSQYTPMIETKGKKDKNEKK